MKFTRNQVSNALLLAFIIILVFTPIGKQLKIGVSRLIAFSPSVTNAEDRTVMETYHWNLQTPGGEPFNLKEAKGKVVLVGLWATWCPQCIAEMPSLQKLYNDYKDKVVFVLVSNEDREVIQTYLSKKEYTLPAFVSRSAPPEALTSKSIPATYLLDKKGAIVIKKIGTADWNSQKVRDLIDTLLAE